MFDIWRYCTIVYSLHLVLGVYVSAQFCISVINAH
jgi:hypothetical protein